MTNNTIIGIDLAKSVFQVAMMSRAKITSNKQPTTIAINA